MSILWDREGLNNSALTAEEQQPDVEYFRNQLGILGMNLDFYTKAELKRALTRLADIV